MLKIEILSLNHNLLPQKMFRYCPKHIEMHFILLLQSFFYQAAPANLCKLLTIQLEFSNTVHLFVDPCCQLEANPTYQTKPVNTG